MTAKELLSKIDQLNIYKSKLEIYLKNHHPNLLAKVLEKTSFLDNDNPEQWKVTFAEQMHCLRNSISQRMLCQTCKKKPVKFRTDIGEYRKNCSSKCAKSSQLTLEQRKKTNIERHGCEWYSNISKSRKTRLKKNNGSQHAEDFTEKVQRTNLERHGDRCWNNIEKSKMTNLERYGVEFPQQDSSIQLQRTKKFAC